MSGSDIGIATPSPVDLRPACWVGADSDWADQNVYIALCAENRLCFWPEQAQRFES